MSGPDSMHTLTSTELTVELLDPVADRAEGLDQRGDEQLRLEHHRPVTGCDLVHGRARDLLGHPVKVPQEISEFIEAVNVKAGIEFTLLELIQDDASFPGFSPEIVKE